MVYVWSLVVTVLVSWGVLIVALLVVRPKGSVLTEALRILPDTVRLLRGLATDASLPRNVRVKLWMLFVYLAIPFDIIPDFIPVVGYADDAILVCLMLRSVVRQAGAEALRRHWPGTEDGLQALWRVAGLTGTA
jgi:uncharacterized membrane protein YkvA (DUF1232 family)